MSRDPNPRSNPARETFHWRECRARLEPLALAETFEVGADRRSFRSPRFVVRPPLVFPIEAQPFDFGTVDAPALARRRAAPEAHGCALADYLARLPAAPARHVVILMQAGAIALGAFERDDPLATKSFKRYVVRGNGRAQAQFLATKGKSRYGARLRLQNARRLVVEAAAKLDEFRQRFGPPERVFVNAPKTLWSEFLDLASPPPLDEHTTVVRIPLDLPQPTTEVLLRTHRALCHGSIERNTSP